MHADVAGGGTKFNIRLHHTGMERADRRAVVCSSSRLQLDVQCRKRQRETQRPRETQIETEIQDYRQTERDIFNLVGQTDRQSKKMNEREKEQKKNQIGIKKKSFIYYIKCFFLFISIPKCP